jgi:hypothetical protein
MAVTYHIREQEPLETVLSPVDGARNPELIPPGARPHNAAATPAMLAILDQFFILGANRAEVDLVEERISAGKIPTPTRTCVRCSVATETVWQFNIRMPCFLDCIQ